MVLSSILRPIPRIQDGGQIRGSRGLKIWEFVFRVVFGVCASIILVVESEVKVQNPFRPKGLPQIQDGYQNSHGRVKPPKDTF